MAIGLRAKVFEKHLTQESLEGAIDSFFSATASVFENYVRDIRLAELAIGIDTFRSDFNEDLSRSKRSIYPRADITKGSLFSKENVGVFRPGFSLAPENLDWLIGKTAKRDLRAGERISKSDVVE